MNAIEPDLDIVECAYRPCRESWDEWHEQNRGRNAWWAHWCRVWRRPKTAG